MTDNYLILHLNSIEEEMKNYIREHYWVITGMEMDRSTPCGQLLDLFKGAQFDQSNLKYLLEKLQENKFEFNILVDVIILLNQNYNSTYKNESFASSVFNSKLLSLVAKEMKLFRNLIHHEKDIDDELIQRFFMDVHFFFKHLRLNSIRMSDYLKKDVPLALKCVMEINMQNVNSFAFNDDKMMNPFPKKEMRKEQSTSYWNNLNYNDDQVKFVLDNSLKTKLFDFDFKVNSTQPLNFIKETSKLFSYSSFCKEEFMNMKQSSTNTLKEKDEDMKVSINLTHCNELSLTEQLEASGRILLEEKNLKDDLINFKEKEDSD